MTKFWRDSGLYSCAKCDQGEEQGALEVSHFYNVRKSGVRFDPLNVDPLHHDCHTGNSGWEYQKKGDYLQHMLRKLGPEGFEELRIRSEAHISLEEAKATLMQRLEDGTLCQAY